MILLLLEIPFWIFYALFFSVIIFDKMLITRRILSKREFYFIKMVGSALVFLVSICNTLDSPGFGFSRVFWSVMVVAYANMTMKSYKEWKKYKDDDDDEFKKRRRSWAKSKLPKIKVVAIRPVTT